MGTLRMSTYRLVFVVGFLVSAFSLSIQAQTQYVNRNFRSGDTLDLIRLFSLHNVARGTVVESVSLEAMTHRRASVSLVADDTQVLDRAEVNRSGRVRLSPFPEAKIYENVRNLDLAFNGDVYVTTVTIRLRMRQPTRDRLTVRALDCTTGRSVPDSYIALRDPETRNDIQASRNNDGNVTFTSVREFNYLVTIKRDGYDQVNWFFNFPHDGASTERCMNPTR